MKTFLSVEFKKAATDYLYLINRGYSKKILLKLVSDKYRLSGIERTALLRGIIEKNKAKDRINKIITKENIKNKILCIDFYNVAFTIESYFCGNPMFIGLDNILRDASEFHGKIINNKLFIRSYTSLIQYLKEIEVKKSIFFIDAPVSFSKETAYELNKLIVSENINASVKVVKSADYYLIKNNSKISATSDSIIIDKVKKTFDIAFNLLKTKFDPDFTDLKKIIKQAE